jgi:hypothetical protein
MMSELDPIQNGTSDEAGDEAPQATNKVSDHVIEGFRAISAEMARLSLNGEESTRNIAEASLAERERAEQEQQSKE